MKVIIQIFLLWIHSTSAVIHSLQFRHTLPGDPNLPEFEAEGLIDDVQIVRYDRNTKKVKPTEALMERVRAAKPQDWEKDTEALLANLQVFLSDRRMRDVLDDVTKRFNQAGGVHTLQGMSCCQWDDETNNTTADYQIFYDGKHQLRFDFIQGWWIAESQLMSFIKQKWDFDPNDTASVRDLLTKKCPEILKKYISYKRSILQGTATPGGGDGAGRGKYREEGGGKGDTWYTIFYILAAVIPIAFVGFVTYKTCNAQSSSYVIEMLKTAGEKIMESLPSGSGSDIPENRTTTGEPNSSDNHSSKTPGDPNCDAPLLEEPANESPQSE